MPERQEVYSVRNGRPRPLAPVTFEQFRRHATTVLSDLHAQDQLQEAFGYYCTDNGVIPGREGSDPDLHFEIELGFPALPFARTVPTIEADQLFDLIAVVYRFVSKGNPKTGYLHEWDQCGWHYRDFDANAAREELRNKLNPLLGRLNLPLELLPAGMIVERPSDPLSELISESIPAVLPVDQVADPVQVATRRYLRARGYDAERRAAVVELAGVLEYMRPQVKTALLSDDESDLFNIANNFALRHRNLRQKSDYDEPTWLPWMFQVYVATIHAVARVIERESKVN